MRTVRRLYFYILALIGAEAVVWGLVSLLRTMAGGELAGASAQLATGLSAVLVGLPVFLLHWLVVQRDAARDEDERASRLRAIFFYAARMAFLIPVFYSTLALFNRWMALALGLPAASAIFGGSQSAADNLIAAGVCLGAFAFFDRTLRQDWRAALYHTFLPEVRRLYRYLWVAFGLVALVAGVQALLRYLLSLPIGTESSTPALLASGLALTLTGAPVWAWTWQLIQASQVDSGEQRSILRLLFLHLAALAGVAGVMAAGGSLLSGLFAWIFGRPQTLAGFLLESASYIAAGIPLSVVWRYYDRILDGEMEAMPLLPRREAVQRFYRSILSALGLVVAFTGILALIELISDLLFASALGSEWNRISTGLAGLGVGLPLWLAAWPGLQREAAARDESGDRARRSVIRRAYLYLAIFALVLGAMAAAGTMFYNLINSLIGPPDRFLARAVLQRLLTLGALAAFLLYHLRALRLDGQASQRSLGSLHAAFPALVLLEGEPELAEEFSREMGRQAPRLPLVIHQVENGAPDDALSSARVVVLSSGLAVDPPEPLRLWLQGCAARRLVLPLPREGWSWLGLPARSASEIAREASAAVRQMAEGEAPRAGLPSNPWAIVGFIFGGIFALQILFALVALVIGSLWR